MKLNEFFNINNNELNNNFINLLNTNINQNNELKKKSFKKMVKESQSGIAQLNQMLNSIPKQNENNLKLYIFGLFTSVSFPFV